MKENFNVVKRARKWIDNLSNIETEEISKDKDKVKIIEEFCEELLNFLYELNTLDKKQTNDNNNN
jgi:hypothetical protein